MSRVGRYAVLEAVEAMYTTSDALDPSRWLAQVLERVHACVDGAVGGFAYAYDISGPPESWSISRPLLYSAPPEMGEHIYESFHAAPPESRSQILPKLGPAGTLSTATGVLLTSFGEGVAERLGVLDAVHVNGVDADDRGILLSLTVPEPRRLAPLAQRRFRMLAAHLTSARRLLLGRHTERPEVIFETTGKVAHVERGHEHALSSLRRRMLDIEGARARSASQDEILTAWQALLLGRYTLVSRIDTDQRRYVIAFENAPGVVDPRGLSETEAAIAAWTRRGHSQKLIAYELGLTVGTVSGMLARIFRKLRVGSRSSLVARLAEPTAAQSISFAGHKVVLFSSPAPDTRRALARLSAAEREVAEKVLDGMTNKAIAEARGTSVRTVMNQLASAYRKLGVGSRAELAALARDDSGRRG